MRATALAIYFISLISLGLPTDWIPTDENNGVVKASAISGVTALPPITSSIQKGTEIKTKGGVSPSRFTNQTLLNVRLHSSQLNAGLTENLNLRPLFIRFKTLLI